MDQGRLQKLYINRTGKRVTMERITGMEKGKGKSKGGGRGEKKKPFPVTFVFLLFILLGFAGCRTPPPALPPVHPSAALPAEADVYFYVSVAENGELLQGFLEDGGQSAGGRYFLEHTRVMYGAARRAQQGGPAFLAAASGDYSVGLVEFGVGRDSAWEEKSVPVGESQARYYRNRDTGMELAIPSPQMILTGSGVAEALGGLYAGAVPPLRGDTLAALESHSAGFYLPRAGESGLPPLLPPSSSIPLKEAALFADPVSGADYAVSGELVFANDTDAAWSSVMLRLLFSGFMGSQGMSLAEIRRALTISIEAEKLRFSGITFPGEMARQMLGALITGGEKQQEPGLR
jgi:hypothetical protein